LDVENRGGSHASSEECSCGDTQNEELNWKGCARGRAAWGGQGRTAGSSTKKTPQGEAATHKIAARYERPGHPGVRAGMPRGHFIYLHTWHLCLLCGEIM
jgi:hypothetical protein